MKKLTLLAAGAAGYVLGARAGRHRYEQIAAGARRSLGNPRVQAASSRRRTPSPSRRRRRSPSPTRPRRPPSAAADKVRSDKVHRGRLAGATPRSRRPSHAGEHARPCAADRTRRSTRSCRPGTGGQPRRRHARAPARRRPGAPTLAELDARGRPVCRACPRLVAWREDVARGQAGVVRRPALLGPADRRLGRRRRRGSWSSGSRRPPTAATAPGGSSPATARGDWLFASLHRVGLATQPTSVHAGDGQRLVGARMVAAVRCAPPHNKPTPAERDTCAPWLRPRAAPASRRPCGSSSPSAPSAGTPRCGALRAAGYGVPAPEAALRPRRRRTVGARTGVTLLGCYHPSQQNTFTGRLTEDMLDDVLGARRSWRRWQNASA